MSTKVYKCASCGEAAEKSGTGLGTWRCLGKCPYYRRIKVNRVVSSGKESEFQPGRRPNIEAVSVNRHIRVSRQTAC